VRTADVVAVMSKGRAFASLTVCLGGIVLVLALGGCAATPADKAAGMAAPPEAAVDSGIRVESLRLTAADYMLDLRFRVTDPALAAPFFSRKTELQLVDPISGARLAVPNTPKLGKLRQVARKDISDRSYFVLFANPGRYLKAGSQVVLVAGDTRIGQFKVE
jgi:hypothetical protein